MTIELALQLATLGAALAGGLAVFVRLGRILEQIEQLQARVAAVEAWQESVDKSLRARFLQRGT